MLCHGSINVRNNIATIPLLSQNLNICKNQHTHDGMFTFIIETLYILEILTLVLSSIAIYEIGSKNITRHF